MVYKLLPWSMMKLARLLVISVAALLSLSTDAADDIPSDKRIEIHQAFNCSTHLRRKIRFATSTPEEPLEIRTPRLILRTGAESDYAAVKRIYSGVDTLQNLYGHSQTWGPSDFREKHDELMSGARIKPYSVLRMWDFVIALRENNKMIGAGTIRQFIDRWEFSAVIETQYRGLGYSSERLEALIHFVREMDPQAQFHATVMKTNLESQAVLQKLKFRREPSTDPNTFSYWLRPTK